MASISPEQLRASDPGASVWVTANAGSGKTTVLTNRVVRLLLAGADPAKILCVTFTKAAAANMQDRIFTKLGEWVALSDAALSEAIAAMTGEQPGIAGLKRARRLFARAVETPGGLKIQTIHSFCERLLHLFPFEAGIPARFEMLDDAQQAAAMERAILATMQEGLAQPVSPLGQALRTIAETANEDGFRQALREMLALRRTMPRGDLEQKFAVSPLRQALGLAPSDTSVAITRRLFTSGLPTAGIAEIEQWLETGSKTDRERAADLRTARHVQGSENIDLYLSVFITDSGTKRKSLSTDGISKARPDLAEALIAEQTRVFDLQQMRLAAQMAERSEALIRLADTVLVHYDAGKRFMSRLDFADLIGKAKDLLTSDAAEWVRFKLDQGIDHILVDEAQDTSPEQWAIIKALSDDFFAGLGARGTAVRTVFAVGDEKQSIFGFQGAKPQEFEDAKRHFRQRIAGLNQDTQTKTAFADIRLEISYRTTGDILAAVDEVFSVPEHFTGLESEPRRTVHTSNRRGKPGLVELWPPFQPDKKEVVDPTAPVDAQPLDAAPARLARRIARRIRHWLDTGARYESDGRKIDAGDILILVRNRGAIFDSVIRELKRQRVPVAGADRMKLLEQIAVLDLLALGHFVLLPEDDLTLAALLKSPLIGLSEDALLSLAHGRGGHSLWDALTLRADETPEFRAACDCLRRWMAEGKRRDPLTFYSTLLSVDGGRSKLLARLGRDAEEAINVFLYRLRQWQSANPPSLFAFLADMAATDADVKRDMEDANGRVRVMTVHGSKGLEAPIVFVADLYKSPLGSKGPRIIDIIPGDATTAAWSPRKAEEPEHLAAGRAEVETLAKAEHRRLLYVALTRAKDRLYLAGAEGGNKVQNSWAEMIEQALADHISLQSVADEAGDGEVRQWRTVKAAPADPSDDQEQALLARTPFSWLRTDAPVDLPRPPPVRPSRIADAAEPPPIRDVAIARANARIRGDLIHLVLQHLAEVAPDRRRAVAASLATARFPLVDPTLVQSAIDAALGLISNPETHHVFASEAGTLIRTEVDIAGQLLLQGRTVDVSGRIDRLMVRDSTVLIVDFKTGRPPARPEQIPEGHLRQLAVYRALAADLYPQHNVSAAVIWTALPALIVIPDADLEAVLARINLL